MGWRTHINSNVSAGSTWLQAWELAARLLSPTTLLLIVTWPLQTTGPYLRNKKKEARIVGNCFQKKWLRHNIAFVMHIYQITSQMFVASSRCVEVAYVHLYIPIPYTSWQVENRVCVFTPSTWKRFKFIVISMSVFFQVTSKSVKWLNKSGLKIGRIRQTCCKYYSHEILNLNACCILLLDQQPENLHRI